MIINSRKDGDDLYEVRITLKGAKAETSVFVYAKNRLEAHSKLINARVYGKQHEIKLHASAAWLDK